MKEYLSRSKKKQRDDGQENYRKVASSSSSSEDSDGRDYAFRNSLLRLTQRSKRDKTKLRTKLEPDADDIELAPPQPTQAPEPMLPPSSTPSIGRGVAVQKRQVHCLKAETVITLPYKYEHPQYADTSYVQKILQERKAVDRDGKVFPLWELDTSLPADSDHLDRHFQSQLGIISETINEDTVLVVRLALTSEAQAIYFSEPRMEVITHSGVFTTVKLSIVKIGLIVYTLGTALLTFWFSWGPNSFSDIATRVYLAKFRHVSPKIFKGWMFGSETVIPDWKDVFPTIHCTTVGEVIGRALYMNEPISLTDIAKWLTRTGNTSVSEDVIILPTTQPRFHDHCNHEKM
eukprot:TRINITY_DN7914_c0_g1_i13.p1 TRINITY_DN7914_c0_g1~~TRINITY_DN7914_c0_g1_i13.p1  ORF type:complete len:361 (-),score=57.71 TRINITY_DN7914_c0_g1_i13:1374-2411(-)